MRRKKFLLGRTFLACTAIWLFAACPTDGGDPSTYENPSLDASGLVDEAMSGAPVFANSDINASFVSRSVYGTLDDYGVSLGSVAFKGVYPTFKEYDPEGGSTMDQGVDGSNIWVSLYNSLYDLGRLMADASYDLSFESSIEARSPIVLNEDYTGPFDYGDHSEATNESMGTTYDTWWAANADETVAETLVSETIISDSSESKSVKYFKHDSGSGALTIDLNYLVRYTDNGEIYSPRLWVQGNTVDSTFQVLAANYGYVDGGSAYPDGIQEMFWSMAGAGSSAADGYMIIFFTAESRLDGGAWTDETVTQQVDPFDEFPVSGWYKLSRSMAEADFSALEWYDSLAELVAAEGDPDDYGSQVSDLTVDMFTDADLDGSTDARMVTSLEDFGDSILVGLSDAVSQRALGD